MSARPIAVSWWACLFVVLGFSMMIVGGLCPTTFGRAVEASLVGLGEQAQTIIMIQQPVSLTLGIQYNEISGAGYLAGPTAPEPATAQIIMGETAVFGGHSNVLNGKITLYVGSTLIQVYATDGQGYYGYKYTNNRGSYVQIQNNGLYLSGGQKILSAAYSQGSTIAFVAKVGTVSSNTVTATVKVPAQPPMGTVAVEGCDHQKYYGLSGSDTIKTCSPIYFEVTVTQSASLISSMFVTYGPQGSATTQQATLTRTIPTGSTFTPNSNPAFTMYYGTLTLPIGTYEVHWGGKYSDQGTQTSYTILSILGYFGVSEPVNMRWYWGAGVFIIGLVLAASGFLMVIPRKRGGP